MVAAFPAPARATHIKIPASREEADLLILELGRMDAIEARNKADFERAVGGLKVTYSARNKVTVDGVEVAIADRRLLVETTLAAYAEANKDTLIDDKRKSVKVNYGTFGWRKQKDSLEAVDGQSSAGRASLLDRLHEYLVEALSKFKELSPVAQACLNPQLTWRKDALIAARSDKRMDAEELRKIGFKLVEGEDDFFVKPGPVDLASQPSSTP